MKLESEINTKEMEEKEQVIALLDKLVVGGFTAMLSVYQDAYGLDITDEDLICDIMDTGALEAEENSPLEDIVILGAITLGTDLGLEFTDENTNWWQE